MIGLTDAHCHLYGLGVELEHVSVRELDSEAAVVQVVADAAKTRPAERVADGRGWDQNRWPGQQFPTKATLDARSAIGPSCSSASTATRSGSTVAALADAGITPATPDPAGGKILRDAKGEPTGV